MANDVSKLPALWRERAQKHQDEADAADCNQERDWWLGRHQSMEDCADELEAALAQQDGAVDRNVESVRTKMLERSAVGLAKYGVTTERGDLSHADWLKHLQEELMDATVYIEAALASSGPGGGGEGAS